MLINVSFFANPDLNAWPKASNPTFGPIISNAFLVKSTPNLAVAPTAFPVALIGVSKIFAVFDKTGETLGIFNPAPPLNTVVMSIKTIAGSSAIAFLKPSQLPYLSL